MEYSFLNTAWLIASIVWKHHLHHWMLFTLMVLQIAYLPNNCSYKYI